MIDHLFRVPEQFWDPALYERFGAIIKDRATGRIVAHLQEVGPWELSSSLPIPGGNPLQLVTGAVQVAQLAGIQRTLDVVQTLATVGAVASVASLGISVVGFSVVTAKLSRMDRKLDQALGEVKKLREAVERLNLKLDALPLATLKARLEEVGLAMHYERARSREALQRTLSDLSLLRHYYHALLADRTMYSTGTSGLPAVLDAHERLVACCQGELMAELPLADDPDLIQRRWRLQQDQLLSLGWQTGRELYELAEEGDRRSGVYSVISPAERAAMVKELVDVRHESLARLASAPYLASLLAKTGTSPSEYMAAVSEWAGDRAVVVVLADHTT